MRNCYRTNMHERSSHEIVMFSCVARKHTICCISSKESVAIRSNVLESNSTPWFDPFWNWTMYNCTRTSHESGSRMELGGCEHITRSKKNHAKKSFMFSSLKVLLRWAQSINYRAGFTSVSVFKNRRWYPYHYRYGTVGSKSRGEAEFFTGNDVLMSQWLLWASRMFWLLMLPIRWEDSTGAPGMPCQQLPPTVSHLEPLRRWVPRYAQSSTRQPGNWRRSKARWREPFHHLYNPTRCSVLTTPRQPAEMQILQ